MNNTISTQPKAVEVSVSTDYLEDVLSLLLTKKISFGMTYKSMVVRTEPPSDFAKEIPESSNVSSSGSLHSPMQRVMDSIYKKYICSNIEQIPPSETIIAEEHQLQVSTFKRNFKACYGKSFYQLYMQKKMEHATKLLKQGLTASLISERLGYSHPIKFNKMF